VRAPQSAGAYNGSYRSVYILYTYIYIHIYIVCVLCVCTPEDQNEIRQECEHIRVQVRTYGMGWLRSAGSLEW